MRSMSKRKRFDIEMMRAPDNQLEKAEQPYSFNEHL